MNKIFILLVIIVAHIMFIFVGKRWIVDWDKNRNVKFTNRIKAAILVVTMWTIIIVIITAF
jgi:uncharacterized membrane protein